MVALILNGFDCMWAILIFNHQDVWVRLKVKVKITKFADAIKIRFGPRLVPRAQA
ncbi:hypothetical protein DsansV1_C11g0113051 [Dioscorea sansibarensis]